MLIRGIEDAPDSAARRFFEYGTATGAVLDRNIFYAGAVAKRGAVSGKPSPDAGFTRRADAPTHLTEAEYTSAVNTSKAARSASGCCRVDLILRTMHGVFS
jgi:hypothetical protein